MSRRFLSLAGSSAMLVLALSAAPAAANHTFGELDCDSAGLFDVDSGSTNPPGFESPGPWAGVFLLHDTTRVFRAYRIVTPNWTIAMAPAEKSPRPLITCTLTSSGPNFESPWTLVGFLAP